MDVGSGQVIRRALVVTLAALASAGHVRAHESDDSQDDLVDLDLDPRKGVAFAFTPRAGEQAAIATTVESNGYDVCIVVPPGSPRRVIAEPYEGRWSIEGSDGRRHVVAVRTDEKEAPRGLSSLTPEEISQLWGVLVDAWSPKDARLMAHVDPTRACVSLSPDLAAPPLLDGKLRYLVVEPAYRPHPKEEILRLSRYPDLRYLRLKGFSEDNFRVDASTIRAPRLEALSLFGRVDHLAALGRLTELRKLDLRGISRLDDPAFLGELHALEELSLSAVEDLRPVGALPALRKIEADAAPVRELPLVAMPSLQLLDITSSPVPSEVVRRFAALNPQCHVRHRFNEILQALFRDATLVRVSWRQRGKRTEITTDERNPAKIAALASKLVVEETTRRVMCGCMPDAWLDVTTQRGTSRIAFNCGTALQTEELPADGNLTPGSVTALEQWLEQHGVDLANCDGCAAHARRRTPQRTPAPPEHEREVVCGHLDDLRRREADGGRDALEVVDVAHAPARVLAAKALVEALVAGRRVLAAALERAVHIKEARRRQHARRAAEQRLGRRPGRDVDHVDVEDRVGVGDGPGLALDVEEQRRRDVLGARAPRRDAREVGRRRVRWLPAEGGQRAREDGHVLARAAGDLEDQAGRREHAAQHLENRLAVALGGRRVKAALGPGLGQRRIERCHAGTTS